VIDTEAQVSSQRQGKRTAESSRRAKYVQLPKKPATKAIGRHRPRRLSMAPEAAAGGSRGPAVREGNLRCAALLCLCLALLGPSRALSAGQSVWAG